MTLAGRKDDTDKTRLALLPVMPLWEIAEVLTFGATKYERENWRKGISFERLFSALQRHLLLWWEGADDDAETGLSHLAHAGCCLFFIMALRHTRPECDDRPHTLA